MLALYPLPCRLGSSDEIVRDNLACMALWPSVGKGDKFTWLGEVCAVDGYIFKELMRAMPMTDPEENFKA